MSTLNVNTITNGSNTVTVETASQGSAKAWVNFNGIGSVAIRDSFNVSSITDNGTGDYTINFTNSMANANYCLAGSCRYTDNSSVGVMRVISIESRGILADRMTPSFIRINTTFNNGGSQDCQVVTAIVLGS